MLSSTTSTRNARPVDVSGRDAGDPSVERARDAGDPPEAPERQDDSDEGVDGVPAAVVDREVLERLVEELEDAALVHTVVTTYLRELPGRIDGIRGAARIADFDVVHDIAHTLKSTSAAVGALGLAELCADIERVARGLGLTGSLEPLLRRLGADSALVEQALRAELTAGLETSNPPQLDI